MNHFEKKGIKAVGGVRISEIKANKILAEDGRQFPCDVPIWATGAEPQKVLQSTDLDILRGYIQVNDFMQSTTYPNVFAGGDCVSFESNKDDKPFPPKAGVYAVREGPFIAENASEFIKAQHENREPELKKYVPQPVFLSLLMTADSSAIGQKWGISFNGPWVWEMKDFIDTSFMKIFDPNYLFRDYKTKGTAEPVENNELFDDESKDDQAKLAEARAFALTLDHKKAAQMLKDVETEDGFMSRWMIIERMTKDDSFRDLVIPEVQLLDQ